MVGGGAVPVPFAAGGVDGVASSDGGDGFSPGLDAAFAFGDVHGLGDGVAVPGGPGAGREMYEADAGRGVSMALGDAVDPDVTGEPVGRSFCCRSSLLQFHLRVSLLLPRAIAGL